MNLSGAKVTSPLDRVLFFFFFSGGSKKVEAEKLLIYFLPHITSNLTIIIFFFLLDAVVPESMLQLQELETGMIPKQEISTVFFTLCQSS